MEGSVVVRARRAEGEKVLWMIAIRDAFCKASSADLIDSDSGAYLCCLWDCFAEYLYLEVAMGGVKLFAISNAHSFQEIIRVLREFQKISHRDRHL